MMQWASFSIQSFAILCLMTINLQAQTTAPNFASGNGGIPNQNNGQFNNQINNQPVARIAANTAPNTPSFNAGGQAINAPIPTDGQAVEAEKSIPMNNLLSVIRQGGVLMLPIIGCSIVLLVFVMERLMYLRRSKVIPRPFVRGVMEQLEQQQLGRDEAIALCEENGSLIAQLFAAGLKKYGRPAVEVEQAVLDAGERALTQMKKYLRLFSSISNVSPLLGLLGTVVGMIEAFNTIASSDAMGRPEMLAGGIGTALITTAAGLMVAIPAFVAHVFFLGRIDKLILEMDVLVQGVVELISAEGLQESSKSRSRSRARAA
jgi:biopolymer transport protein ExbB